MDYDRLYLIALIVVLYALYYQWSKNRHIKEEDIEVFCKNCGEKIDTLIFDKDSYEYTCKKCKHKGIVTEEDLNSLKVEE